MITYTDTSFLLKLLLDDEAGVETSERLWLDSDHLVCAEVGYVEARAALAAAHRASRIDADGLATAKEELDDLWSQVDRVAVSATLISAAADIAEIDGLRGYDAVHLAAAIQAGATTVATFDKQLLAAASRRGLDTANPISQTDGD